MNTLSLTLTDKINIIQHLPGCGWHIREQAQSAAEALAREKERHERAMREIVETFDQEAWRHVSRAWSNSELLDALKQSDI